MVEEHVGATPATQLEDGIWLNPRVEARHDASLAERLGEKTDTLMPASSTVARRMLAHLLALSCSQGQSRA